MKAEKASAFKPLTSLIDVIVLGEGTAIITRIAPTASSASPVLPALIEPFFFPLKQRITALVGVQSLEVTLPQKLLRYPVTLPEFAVLDPAAIFLPGTSEPKLFLGIEPSV